MKTPYLASEDVLERRSARLAFGSVIFLAIVIRVTAAFLFPNIAHADEIFQVQEQAHRVVYGSGITPWEFVIGIRSWIFPGLLVGIAEICRVLGGGTESFVVAVKLFMIAISVIPICCGWRWGHRLFGLGGAIIVSGILAAWVDLVYYSSHSLSEVFATNFFVAGLCIVEPGDRTTADRRMLFFAGLCLGLALVVRIQLAPAIGLIAICACWGDLMRRWLPFSLGAGFIILMAGLIDYLTWGSAFRSIWLNVWVNVFLSVSEVYGVDPWYRYAGVLFFMWGGAFAVIAMTALVGASRLPLVLAVAATVLITHTLLGHKEPRFIFPAIPLVFILCGIGTCEICKALSANALRENWLTIVAVSCWVLTSAALAVSPYYQSMWEHNRGVLTAFGLIAADKEACGVGFVAADVDETDKQAGQTNLPPDVPIYFVPNYDVTSYSSAFNFVITSGREPNTPEFKALGCFYNGRFLSSLQPRPQSCLWRRTGPCTANNSILPPIHWPKDLRQWAISKP